MITGVASASPVAVACPVPLMATESVSALCLHPLTVPYGVEGAVLPLGLPSWLSAQASKVTFLPPFITDHSVCWAVAFVMNVATFSIFELGVEGYLKELRM